MTDADDWPPRPPADDPQPGEAEEWTTLDETWQSDAPPHGPTPQTPDRHTPDHQHPAGHWPPPHYPPTQYGMPQHGTPQYGAPHFGTPQYGMPHYGMSQYGMSQYGPGRPPFTGAPASQAPTALLPTTPPLGGGLRWARSMFVPNAAVMVAAALVWAIVFVIAIVSATLVLTVALLLMNLDSSMGYQGFPAGVEIAVSVILAILMSFVGAVAMACWFNGLVGIADGRRVDLGDFFRPRAFGAILGVTLLLGLIAVVVDLVVADQLGLPWVATLLELAVALVTMWMVYVAADQETDVTGALSGGVDLFIERPGPSVVVFLMSVLLAVVGAVALLIGLLAALPISGLLMMYYLRSLTQRPIAVESPPPGPYRA